MSSYYVRIKPQLNGTYAVHKKNCPFLPPAGNRLYLGEFNNCYDAVCKARQYFSEAENCYFCSRESIYSRQRIVNDWGITFYVNIFTGWIHIKDLPGKYGKAHPINCNELVPWGKFHHRRDFLTPGPLFLRSA